MRTWLAITMVAAQLGVLAFMAGEREWIMRTGRTMHLRTAPVDPRDPMRGDYVRFDYEIARLPRGLARDGVVAWFEARSRGMRQLRDQRVFAEVKLDEEGVAHVVAVSDRAPAPGPFLRGRVQSIDGQSLRVRFGIEALFMEQGAAKALEDLRQTRAGVPLAIEIAVSDAGVAVMKGYRWEPLGLTLTPDRAELTPGRAATPNRTPRAALRGATVELKNHSEHAVAIVVRPAGQSFRLVTDERGPEAAWRWANEDAPVPKPAPGMVRVLRPGESYREHLDFTAPAWLLRETKTAGRPVEPVPWGRLPNLWSVSFRIEYAPPGRAECAGLPNAELIRHSRLSSRAFTAAGGVD